MILRCSSAVTGQYRALRYLTRLYFPDRSLLPCKSLNRSLEEYNSIAKSGHSGINRSFCSAVNAASRDRLTQETSGESTTPSDRINSPDEPKTTPLPYRWRSATGFSLANEGQDTRAIQHYLGHKNIQHTIRYTALSPERFNDFWRN